MKVLYHANCTDGAGAALAVWMKHGDDGHEYIPVQYGHEPPEGLEGSDVVMVDFSYKKEQIRDLASIAKSILIIDHHKTAQAELEDVDDGEGCPIETLFDMECSGAVLSWFYFNPDRPLPELFLRIQDRDLWQHRWKESNAITTGLQTHSDWRTWIKLFETDNDSHQLLVLQSEGRTVMKYLAVQTSKIIKTPPTRWPLTMDTVPVYNLPGFMLSDTLHAALMEYPDAPYAVGYFDLSDKRVYSLRSRSGTDIDVSEIAKNFGGGGHKHAAGFTKPLSDLG